MRQHVFCKKPANKNKRILSQIVGVHQEEVMELKVASMFTRHKFHWVTLLAIFAKLLLVGALTHFGFTLWSTVASTALFLCLSSWTMLFPKKAEVVLLLVLNAIASLVLLSDYMFYMFYHSFITTPILYQAWQAGGVEQSILSLFSLRDLLFFADFIALIPWAFVLFRRLEEPNIQKNRERFYFTSTCFLIGLVLANWSTIRVQIKYGSQAFENMYSNNSLLTETGLFNYHLTDYYEFRQNASQTALPVQELRTWEESRRRQEGNVMSGAGKGRNLIVIQMEAMQGFLIGSKINGQEITPYLNRFLKETMYFDNYFTQIAQGTTSDAEFMSLNSLYPLPSGAAYILKSGNNYYSLPRAMRDAGYGSYAFHAFNPDYWNRSKMYPKEGFQRFYNVHDYKVRVEDVVGLGLSDEQYFTQTLPKIKTLKEPYMAFMVTLSGHHPYVIPDRLKDLKIPTGTYSKLFSDYLQAQHYADKHLGVFLENLRSQGILDKSVVAIYGDHFGPELNASEIYRFIGQPKVSLTAYDTSEINRVPLFIRLPKATNIAFLHITGGQMDFYPTIANLMGLDKTKMFTLGQDLLNNNNGFATFREFIPSGSVVTNDHFYLASLDGIFENGACYDRTNASAGNTSTCRSGYNIAKWQLRMSDLILQNNGIPQILQRTE